MTLDISITEARRMALAAQGFGARPTKPTLVHMRKVLTRLGAIQIDAVNVLARSHLLPMFSRLGPYPLDLFDRLVFTKRHAFDYWGHAASYMPVELYPALRWRMAAHADSSQWASTEANLERQRPGYIDAILSQIDEQGPLAFTDLTDPGRIAPVKTKYAESSLLWSRWSVGKMVLESLYGNGVLAVAGRKGGFERQYDRTERVIPPEILALPIPSTDEAHRQLIAHAASSLGVGTIKDLADYFRLPNAVTRARTNELVEDGVLQPTKVEGWKDNAFVYRDARTPKPTARALLSPFDSVTWERARNERLFNFRHSFEIYVPAAKRQYGYYVLPFLLNDAIVARVDLKADRANRALLVRAAYAEPGHHPKAIAGPLTDELNDMARWLALDRVEIADKGDLAPALRRAG